MENAAQLIQKQIDNHTLAAAALQVRHGKSTWVRHFGSAGSAEAMFLLGSISKPLTAMGVMVLVDRGEVKLSDPAMKYLPEFSEGARKDVTVEHLLVHTSGLPDQLPDNNALRAKHAPLSEFVAGAVRVPLQFAPGTKYHYQSMGILLAAELLERVTGQKLPAFLDEHVFRPLRMTRTVMGLGSFGKEAMVPMQTEHAAPEAGAGDPTSINWDWNSDYWRALAAPWGGAHSTVGDLTLLLDFLLQPDGRVMKVESVREMLRDHTPGLEAHRGIGFMLGSGFGAGCSAETFGHFGSTGTMAWADAKSDTTCVLLTSLPKNVSGDLILDPVSDLVSSLR